MAATKKKSTGERVARKGQDAAAAEVGLGLQIGGGIRRKGRKPPLSDADLEAAASYVDILRWVVETYDRHEREVSRLKALPSAMRALRALGADRALADIASQVGLKSVSSNQRLEIAPFILPPEPVETRLARHFEHELAEACGARDDYARRLLLREGRDPVALFAELKGLDRDAARELSREDLRIELYAAREWKPPADPEARLAERNYWLALAVADVEALLKDAIDQELLRQAATRLCIAKGTAQKERTASQVLREVRDGSSPSFDSELLSAKETLLQLLNEARSSSGKVALGDENGQHTKIGPHDVARMIVARLAFGSGASFSRVRDACDRTNH